MQVGDEVLILADQIDGTDIEVPDRTYGTVAEVGADRVGSYVLVELGNPIGARTDWFFGPDELEVTKLCR